MTTTIKALLLEDVLLPRTTGELGLESTEASFITGSDADMDVEVPALVLAYRARDASGVDRMSADTGAVLRAGLLVSGVFWPARHDELPPRLALGATRRVRLETLTGPAGEQVATFTPWPYRDTDLEDIQALVMRFYRVLLTSRDGDEDGLVTQIEEPIGELEAAADPLTRLLLLGDYLLATPEARTAVLTAESARDVVTIVEDTLSMIEGELPSNIKAVRQGIAAYLNAIGAGEGERFLKSTQVLGALAPLLEPPKAILEEFSKLTQELTELDSRRESLILRLLNHRRRP